MKQVIVITGASSGFGRLSANALAKGGHTVYASMRDTTGRNAAQVADVQKYAKDNQVDLRAIELDVGARKSVDAAIAKIVAEQGRLDVVIHNAGHMVFGPAEAFTPEQLAELYDVNVLSTQRVNRAALPQLRKQGKGLLVWVSSSSSAGGTPPYLAPYFAAKAANGCDGGGLCARTHALGHRNLHHRAGCLYRRHQSFRACGFTRRCGTSRGI
jgi:NAD(P)-dependent dehydrogenase (short-subunit alcohol dehydrogenase family)